MTRAQTVEGTAEEEAGNTFQIDYNAGMALRGEVQTRQEHYATTHSLRLLFHPNGEDLDDRYSFGEVAARIFDVDGFAFVSFTSAEGRPLSDSTRDNGEFSKMLEAEGLI